MRIMHGIQVVFLKYLVKVADVCRQVIYINSRVFNYRHRFAVAGQIA